MKEYKIASLNFSDDDRKYFANISLKKNVEKKSMIDLEDAVMGIDLGVKKTAYSCVMTQTGIQYRKTWHTEEKFRELDRITKQYASLQTENHFRKNNNLPRGNIRRKLTELKNKRKIISPEYDRILARELADHIAELTDEFNLRVAIGEIKGIRNRAKKGNGMGRRYRKMINSWAFFRFTNLIIHRLSELGLKNIIFQVKESWTSIMCYKCNTKGIRPTQSYFKCLNLNCGVKNNADFNGAMNIAKRQIQKLKLIPIEHWGKTGLGRFLPVMNTPKVKSIKRGERSGTTKEVEVTSVPVHVVWDDDAPGGILYNVTPEVPLSANDNTMYNKYGKTISEGIFSPIIRVEGSESP